MSVESCCIWLDWAYGLRRENYALVSRDLELQLKRFERAKAARDAVLAESSTETEQEEHASTAAENAAGETQTAVSLLDTDEERDGSHAAASTDSSNQTENSNSNREAHPAPPLSETS